MSDAAKKKKMFPHNKKSLVKLLFRVIDSK